MKRTLIFSLLVAGLLFGPLTAMALSPKEIVLKSDKLEDGESSVSEMTMILIDKNKNQRIRKMKGYRKDYGADKKSINFFMSPNDVRNTAFMSYEYDDEAKEDDNWLYMPSLRSVKRIAGGNKKDNFMGTDFTYNDMNGLKVEEWSYSMVKESDMVDGQDCWVIGAVPREDIASRVIRDTGYVKRLVWIRKDNFMAAQGRVWLKKGGKLKVMKAEEIKQVQGIWTAGKLTMQTLSKSGHFEHATILVFDNMKYNIGVDDSFFTTQRMEKGL